MTTFWTEDPTLLAALLATLPPFLAFVVVMVVTRPRPRLSAGLSLGAIALSFGSAMFLLISHWDMKTPIQYTAPWLNAGNLHIPLGFLLDPVSLLMLVVVVSISLLIQLYSLGYMAGDPGFSRYYAFMSLFAWAMMCLVISPNLFQLYIFWELVGVSSYLLIGFWYEKFSASQAGKKAFVMTRAGDVALFLGILLVLGHLGNLNIVAMDSADLTSRMSPAILNLSAVLIFGGIIGKSAQFPLLTWLPDAMEGPTPVSALLHSSTMVAAGVYLFERLFPFFAASPVATTFGLAIGTISMLLASTMAMVSRDIKKILAYSTISQLGFMIMGLDAGNFFSGAFHLTTHAGFKALLFLCAGVFIHKYATNDLFELSELGCRGLKIPMISMVIAAGALAGLPPLSGFFSKEVILAGLAGLTNPLWLGAGLVGVFLTAYYAFRMIFILLFPRAVPEAAERTAHQTGPDPSAAHHRGSYRVMAFPLIILTTATILLGFLQHPLERFLETELTAAPWAPGHHYAWLPFAALFLSFGGIALAWTEYGRKGASQIGFVERMPSLYRLFAERWYLDDLYRILLDRLIDRGISRLFYENDNKVIDGSLDGLGRSTVAGGRVVALLHTGMIQYRLLVTFAVMVLLALYFFF